MWDELNDVMVREVCLDNRKRLQHHQSIQGTEDCDGVDWVWLFVVIVCKNCDLLQ